MNCQEVRNLVEDAMDRRLSPDVKRDIELHLSRCVVCRRYFEAESREHIAWFRGLNTVDDIPAAAPDLAERLIAAQKKSWKAGTVRVPVCIRRVAVVAALLGGVAFAAWMGSEVLPDLNSADALSPRRTNGSVHPPFDFNMTTMEVDGPMKTASSIAMMATAMLNLHPGELLAADLQSEASSGRVVLPSRLLAASAEPKDKYLVFRNGAEGGVNVQFTKDAYWEDSMAPVSGDNVHIDVKPPWYVYRVYLDGEAAKSFAIGKLSSAYPYWYLDFNKSTSVEEGYLSIADPNDFTGTIGFGGRAVFELQPSEEFTPVVGRISVNGGPTIRVAQGRAVVSNILDEAVLRKDGLGELEICRTAGRLSSFDVREGTLTLHANPRPSANVDVAAVLARAELHLDASRTGCLTFADATAKTIATWADGRTGKTYTANATTTPDGTTPTACPTLLENYANGLPVVDFGPYSKTVDEAKANGSAWMALSKRFYYPENIFVVFAESSEDESRGSVFVDQYGSNHYRGENGALYTRYFGGVAAQHLGNDDQWVNGCRVSQYHEYNGTNLKVWSSASVLTNTSDYIPFNQVGTCKGISDFGGVRIAEFIVFDSQNALTDDRSALTEDERLAVTDHLRRKWLQPDEQGDVDVNRLTLAEGTVLNIPANETVHVRDLVVEGTLVKTGGGTLHVDHVTALGVYAVDLRGGRLELPEPYRSSVDPVPSAGAVYHFDPSIPGTIDSKVDEQGKKRVTEWRDCEDEARKLLPAGTAGGVTFDLPEYLENAANGLPVVSTGSPKSKTSTDPQLATPLRFNTSAPDDNTANFLREGFVVFRNSGNSFPFLFGGTSTFPFHPGSGVRKFLWARYADGRLTGGEWTLDGRPFDPILETWPSAASGFHVLRFTCSRKVFVNTLALDRDFVSGAGGVEYGEILLYSRSLSPQARLDTESYLMKKWLNQSHPSDRDVVPNALTCMDQTVIANDMDLSLPSVAVDGLFVKEGDGILTVGAFDTLPKGLVVREGELSLRAFEMACAAAAFHVDASCADTFTSTAKGGVSAWRDVRGAGYPVANVFVNPSGAEPQRIEDACNGLAVVDFGEVVRYDTYMGGTGSGSALDWDRSLNVKEFFMVFRDSPTGARNGFLLTENNYGYSFHRGSGGQLLASFALEGARQGIWTLDGESVGDPMQTVPVPSDFHVVSCAITNGTAGAANSFLHDRGYSAGAIGGMSIAEALIYTNNLTAAQRELIVARLRKKWRNVAMPGNEYEFIEVDAAGHLDCGTDFALTSGGGMALCWMAGATDAPVTVQGKMAVPGNVTVTVDGLEDFHGDELWWPIVSAAGFTAAENLASWTLEGSLLSKRRANLCIQDNDLCVHVYPIGLAIIIR